MFKEFITLLISNAIIRTEFFGGMHHPNYQDKELKEFVFSYQSVFANFNDDISLPNKSEKNIRGEDGSSILAKQEVVPFIAHEIPQAPHPLDFIKFLSLKSISPNTLANSCPF